MTTVDTPAPQRGAGPEGAQVEPPVPDNTVRGSAGGYLRRLRGGDMGVVPAAVGLVILCTLFGTLRPRFFTAFNFANMFQQGAAVTIIAMGLIFVLLLGEIDLSAGFTGGVAATAFAVMLTDHGVQWQLCLAAAIGIGVGIGLLLGSLVAKVGIPSFVVTLAAFLAFQGVMLLFLSGGKIIRVQDPTVISLESNSMPVWLGWTLLGLLLLAYLGVQLRRRSNRKARALPGDSLSLIALRVGALALVTGAAVFVLSQERSINPLFNSLRGVPVIVPLVAALALVWTFVLSRTSYGLHLYAVGGNKEAARRAGIRVDAIRMSAFVICSSMAALGGIVIASRDSGVSPTTGGSTVLLYAVGAAVIGGTSLFGGKGRILDAVIGGAVIAVIDNGMTLITDNSGIKYIVTGLVLLVAAGVDALSRRRAAATGQ